MKLNDLPYWGQILLFAALALAASYFYFEYLYKPIDTDLKKQVKIFEDNVSEIRLLKSQRVHLAATEKQIADYKEQLLIIESQFPSQKDDVIVKSFVEDIASEFDIKINSYRAGSNIEAEDYLERQVNLRTSGRTQDYIRFLYYLTIRKQVIHIYGMSLSRQTKGEDATLARYPVTADLSISSYIQIPLEIDGDM
jgi:Tfp pilus assembly protein PilO